MDRCATRVDAKYVKVQRRHKIACTHNSCRSRRDSSLSPSPPLSPSYPGLHLTVTFFCLCCTRESWKFILLCFEGTQTLLKAVETAQGFHCFFHAALYALTVSEKCSRKGLELGVRVENAALGVVKCLYKE